MFDSNGVNFNPFFSLTIEYCLTDYWKVNYFLSTIWEKKNYSIQSWHKR